ncbi:MAG TPA: MFS transporter [Pseudomonadales bacterium]|nr:MFS transporter [Pseudomonadales bacterium]
MNGTDYVVVWAGYLTSALLVMAGWWWLTRWFPVWLRDPLRAIALVVLLTPTLVDSERGLYAPALFVAGFELVTAADGGTGAVLAVRLLLSAMVAAFAAWTLRLLWYGLFARRRGRRTALK